MLICLFDVLCVGGVDRFDIILRLLDMLFRRSLRFTRSPYTPPTTAIRPIAAAIFYANIICFDDTD